MTRRFRWPKILPDGRARQALGRLFGLPWDCRGVLLMETLMAVMVFALVGSAVLSGLSTARISGSVTERQSVAENIARNQIAYVFSLPYQDPPSSCPTISVPTGYAVTCATEEYIVSDPNLERVAVTVSFDGAQLLVLETLRTK